MALHLGLYILSRDKETSGRISLRFGTRVIIALRTISVSHVFVADEQLFILIKKLKCRINDKT